MGITTLYTGLPGDSKNPPVWDTTPWVSGSTSPAKTGGTVPATQTPPTIPGLPKPEPTSRPGLPSSPSYQPVFATPASKGKVYWNPPPHVMMKPPRIDWGVDWQAYAEHNRTVTTSWSSDGPQFMEARGRLGSIFTRDVDDHGARWGCQFQYNPTSISLGASSLQDDTLSAEQFAEQSATQNLLGAFGSLTFELFFNRVYDVAFPGENHYTPRLEKGTNPAKEDQAKLIQKLGTNYDIEFLYRACNGDPKPSQLLGYATSDLGILVFRPVLFSLGPFRYHGVINNISVNHIMFTPNMVPTFSSVSVSFTRFAGDVIPTTADGATTDGASYDPLDADNRAAYNIGQPGR